MFCVEKQRARASDSEENRAVDFCAEKCSIITCLSCGNVAELSLVSFGFRSVFFDNQRMNVGR